MKTKTITLSISKTVQIDRYEPLEIRIERVVEVEDDEDPADVELLMYKQLSNSVIKYIRNEKIKWGNENGGN